MKKPIATLALAVLALSAAGDAQPRSRAWELLRSIVLIPGVSGHEAAVADFIQKSLPAGLKVQRDAMHNVWFTIGSGKPHVLFVAHLDELGWIVDAITPDGRVKVKAGGGVLPQTSEARPVVIDTPHGGVPGIIAPRPGYDARRQENAVPQAYNAENFEIVLGAASEKEARDLGVAEGQPVTIKKTIVDFSPTMMATRAVDDRAGCAALLDAALRLKGDGQIGKTVTFAWDVQEEIGLLGAAELVKVLRPDYVFAVDTFVSTDSPLESKRFGNMIIGKGAVIRAIDSSNVVPTEAMKRLTEIARQRNIPLQAGSSRGGNDGSVFVPRGSVDIPLSWPGAYAHSFIEKIDRDDLEALSDLVLAIARDWN